MNTKQIIAHLESNDDKQLTKVLSALQVDGSPEVLFPLAKLLQSNADLKREKQILEVFSSLKDTRSVEKIMEIIRDDSFKDIQQRILTTIWNSPLDYTYYLADFVLIAAEGTFMEALDCLTIIENMSGPFEEQHILESQWHLKEYLEDSSPKEERKAQIMSEIALFIKDADQDIDG